MATATPGKLAISLPEEVYEAVEILAEAEDVTVNYFISFAVVQYVNRHGFSVANPKCCKALRRRPRISERISREIGIRTSLDLSMCQSTENRVKDSGLNLDL